MSTRVSYSLYSEPKLYLQDTSLYFWAQSSHNLEAVCELWKVLLPLPSAAIQFLFDLNSLNVLVCPKTLVIQQKRFDEHQLH